MVRPHAGPYLCLPKCLLDYLERVDSAPLQSASLDEAMRSAEAEAASGNGAAAQIRERLPGVSLDHLWSEADAGSAGLSQAEFADVLEHVGRKCNFGLLVEKQASPQQAETFWRGLHLRELALAHGCALGHDAAWKVFFSEYRTPLTQAAIAITRSASLGPELADSLYSELFGLTEHNGQRRSPLASYSGRGSLMGWLRTTLAQRHVDHHRRTHREAPLENTDLEATKTASTPSADTLCRVKAALTAAIKPLGPEARFLLASWFLDGRTLLQIARVMRVHEATVSRQIKRLTEKLHTDVLRNLQSGGLSRRAAEEALGTDPRDIEINLRNLLQSSEAAAFHQQVQEAGQGKP